MAGSVTWRRAWRGFPALLLAFCLTASGAGCGKKEGQSPQGTPGAQGFPSENAAGETRQGSNPVSSGGGFSVFVVPSSPSRIAPPSMSVKSPPGRGADVLNVQWFVNGSEQESGPTLSPSRFQRGDRIRAAVKLRAGGEEILLTTPEVIAVNALPGAADVRLDPRAPFSGSTVRAVVQARDPDGDPLTYKYQWYVNDSPVAGNGDSLALTGVKKGSSVYVTVTPNDGFADGAWKRVPAASGRERASRREKRVAEGTSAGSAIHLPDRGGGPGWGSADLHPEESAAGDGPSRGDARVAGTGRIDRSQRGGGGGDLRQRRGPDGTKHLDDDPTAEMNLEGTRRNYEDHENVLRGHGLPLMHRISSRRPLPGTSLFLWEGPAR